MEPNFWYCNSIPTNTYQGGSTEVKKAQSFEDELWRRNDLNTTETNVFYNSFDYKAKACGGVVVDIEYTPTIITTPIQLISTNYL